LRINARCVVVEIQMLLNPFAARILCSDIRVMLNNYSRSAPSSFGVL